MAYKIEYDTTVHFLFFLFFLEICAAGQEILDPDTTCSDCPFDTYQNVTNPFAYTDLCVDCPSNTGTAQRMSSSFSDCMRELLIKYSNPQSGLLYNL